MKKAVSRLTIICISLTFISLMFTTKVDAKIEPESIAGLWLFDEGKGKVAKDISGNGYDGELKKNPLWVDGRFGKALEFNGGNYVELKDSSAGLPFGGVEPFSITAWVKNRGGGTVIGKFNGGVIGAYILVISGGGTVTFHREVAPWGLSGSKTIPPDEFGHVAATYDGVEMKIYVNGELDVKQARPAQNTDTVTPVLIGARFTGGNPSNFFNGVLDEVALFNVALTKDDIKAAMRSLSPSAVSLSGKIALTWGSIKE
ncbi:MAG: LamG domain-containing protein [Candidatus Poribacteria bacterium]